MWMQDQPVPEPNVVDVDVRAALRPLRTRWWIVVLTVVIVTAAAYFLDARKAKVYQAATSIYVNTSADPTAQFSTGSQVFSLETNQLADLAQLLEAPSAAVLVEKDLAKSIHQTIAPNVLANSVRVLPSSTTDFIDITAMSTSPRLASAIANGYAEAFIQQGSQQTKSQLQQIRLQTEDQLAALPAVGQGVSSQRQTLEDRLRAVQNAFGNPNTSEQQVVPAVPPAGPISPHPKKIAIFALALSLLAAVVLVYLLERLDRRLKDVDALSAEYGFPLIAVIPHSSEPDPREDGLPALPAETIEALRMLKMGIGLQALDSPAKTLLVTSAVPNEGKSTVARDLALVYAEAGADVVVVDADLRRGTLSREFGVHRSGAGLTGILLDETTLQEAQVEAKVAAPSDIGRGSGRSTIQISLIPSGGPAANPPAILGSERMASLLSELRAEHEIVIIDTPPLLPVSDTLPLLSMVDGVLIVGRVKQSRRDAVRRAKSVLVGMSHVRVLGFIANDAQLPAHAYGYTYENLPKPSRRASRKKAPSVSADPPLPTESRR